MGKNRYLNITIGLLAIIAILLGIGVVTTPNEEKVLESSSKTSSTVTMKNNMSTLREIEDEEELIDYLEDNNVEGDYTDYVGLDLSDYYFVSFDSNGGSDVESQIIEYGKTASKPENPIRSCYTFNGWYLDGERYYFSTKVKDDIILEAKWTYNTDCDNKKTYTVKFDSNGGSTVKSQTVVSGKKAIEPSEPKKDGYEFDGWYYNGSRYYFTKTVTKNITLEAKWSEIEEYTVKFDSNGGTSVKTQYVDYGDYAYEPSEPVRNGYTFEGWYLNGYLYDFDDKVTEDIKLKAKWTYNKYNDDEEYTVKFDSNGGTSVKTQYVDYGDYAYEPSDPKRTGYIFKGWYLDGYLYDFDDKVTEDITLEAKWTYNKYNDDDEDIYEAEEYTVKFDSNGGTSVRTQYVDYGDYVDMPDEPERDGYEFDGWYLDGYLYDFDDKVTEDIILEAKWSKEKVQYSEYCKIEEETHYSISYITENTGNTSYDWTINLDNIDAKNVYVTDVEYLSGTSDYNKAYKYSYNKQISKANDNVEYNVLVPSGNTLKDASLKSNNFTKELSTPYYEDGDWKIDASVKIRSYSNISPYYSDNLGEYVYFVPFLFTIKYTDLDNCEVDLSSRKSKYSGYYIVDTFYQ